MAHVRAVWECGSDVRNCRQGFKLPSTCRHRGVWEEAQRGDHKKEDWDLKQI